MECRLRKSEAEQEECTICDVCQVAEEETADVEK